MSVLRFSARRVLLAATVVAASIGVGAAVYYLVPAALGPHDPAGHQETTRATVTRKAACDAADPYDTVTFRAGGRQQHARLNGCGNTKGSHVRIVVPGDVGKETVVSLAVTEKGTVPGGYHRASVALLVLGCVAGAGYGFLVRSGRNRGPGEGGTGNGTGGGSEGGSEGGAEGGDAAGADAEDAASDPLREPEHTGIHCAGRY